MILGAQFYTVKDFTKDLDSFAETLKKVADIGYTTVQISGTCDFEADWLAEQLKATGLKCVLTHTKPQRILEETKKVCDEHKTFGCRNIGLGMMPNGKIMTDEVYDKFIADFTPAIKEIAKNDCKFFFHNHAAEFLKAGNGKTYMEKLMDDFTADELNFTLDTYWVQYAGCNSEEWLRKLGGRLECIHLKDMTMYGEKWEHRMAPVGSGTMNFESIINTAADCGVSYLLVEQDKCYDEDPFDCLTKSYKYLTSLGLK